MRGNINKYFGKDNSNYKHGMKGTKFYNSWQGMKRRCLNPKEFGYPYYGGRGIKVCDKWLKFEGFYEDMFSTHFEDATLERIDVNGNYCKENCKWIKQSEQLSNTRKNIKITYKNKTLTLKEWSIELGINYQTLWNRIVRYKIPIQLAFIKGINFAGQFNKLRFYKSK